MKWGLAIFSIILIGPVVPIFLQPGLESKGFLFESDVGVLIQVSQHLSEIEVEETVFDRTVLSEILGCSPPDWLMFNLILNMNGYRQILCRLCNMVFSSAVEINDKSVVSSKKLFLSVYRVIPSLNIEISL